MEIVTPTVFLQANNRKNTLFNFILSKQANRDLNSQFMIFLSSNMTTQQLLHIPSFKKLIFRLFIYVLFSLCNIMFLHIMFTNIITHNPTYIQLHIQKLHILSCRCLLLFEYGRIFTLKKSSSCLFYFHFFPVEILQQESHDVISPYLTRQTNYLIFIFHMENLQWKINYCSKNCVGDF